MRATDAADEPEKPIDEKVAKSAPPWMVSMVVHMVALIVLGLITFVELPSDAVVLEVTYAEEIGVQLDDSVLDSPLMEEMEVDKAMLSFDMKLVDDPLAATPQINDIVFDNTSGTMPMEAPSIGMALTGREKGAREALLAAYGGTATTESAVRKGLEWLRRNQEAKGTWSLQGPYTAGAPVDNRISATSMALLAFQGNGQTHQEGDFKKEVGKAWTALLEMQDLDGRFYNGEGGSYHHLYSQAQATIALCEIYGMTKDPKFKKPAQMAIQYAVKWQDPQRGGWRYTPGQDSDVSVTGWFVIALQSAMMAGLEVPSPTLEKISQFLDSVAYDNGTKYAYKVNERGPTLSMTAEALLCRQYLGWSHSDPRLRTGADYLIENPIQFGSVVVTGEQSSYYWYYATQVAHHMEGTHWKKWNEVMREVIPKNQEQTGKEAGSWTPHDDKWASGGGGRLYQTCLCIYMLEVYYRHLPIYKWKVTR